jgi:pimeloyl-ACP methyl ester carboxylesterase
MLLVMIPVLRARAHTAAAAAILAILGCFGPSGAAPAAAQDVTFRIFGQGRTIGSETVTVLVTADTWKVMSSGQIAAPIALNTRLCEVTYDRDWHPKSLFIDAVVKGKTSTVRTTFSGGGASSDIVQEERNFQKTDPVDARTIVMPYLIFGTYEALAARLSTAQPGAVFKVYVAPDAEITVTLGAVSTERVSAPGRTFEARKHALTFANPGSPLAADLWTDNGRLMRLSMPSVGLEVVRDDVATVAARTSSHYRPNDTDVTVPANGFNLVGTMSKPEGAAATAKLPAVVLIAGSGPVDRDETVAGIPVFAQLASALADAGFAVVRFDKRGIGQSGGRAESATTSDFADDVGAIVKFLEKRKDVDKERIFLVGHSEGAGVGLLATRRTGRVRGLVLIAGVGTKGADLILEQQKHILDASKLSDADKAAKIELQKKIQAAVLSGKGLDDIPAELRRQVESPWFASFLSFDPAPLVAKLDQPILVIQGALDTQVPPHHAEKLGAMANARKNAPKTEVVIVPGINHLLVPARTGEVSEYPTLTDRTISPEITTKIADWLKAH